MGTEDDGHPMIERLDAALGDRYHIERELGAGGMATVFLADEPKHSRKVAIKVLHPELSAVIGAERFLTEIRTTANLQHPHILPLFDSGEADGLLFYVMPFVDGESLRQRLDRERQLPVKEAVRITDGIASALDYAHRQGIIHRDIKPANILLHDGQPLVADFGIALALTAAGRSGRMTETGLSLGTPHYMSPEQASGEGTLDPRSDVYALGCVLYEMLVGDPPFPGSSPQAVLARVLTTEADRTRTHRASVPPHVDAVVARAMERIPADRFDSIGEMRGALQDEAFRHGVAATDVADAPAGASRAMTAAVALLSVLSVVLLITTWVGWRRGSPSGDAPYRVLDLDVPEGGWVPRDGFDLSPDGRMLAIIDSANTLRIVPTDGSPPRSVPGAQQAFLPKFSLDGTQLAFGRWGAGAEPRLFRTASDGSGALVEVGPLPWPDWTWGPGGTLYFGTQDGIRRYPAEGGTAETPPQPAGFIGEVLQSLPDGRVLVEVPRVPNGVEIALWDPATGAVATLDNQPDPVGTIDARARGGLLFWTDVNSTLFVARFDPDGAGVESPPVRLVDGIVRGVVGSLFTVGEDGTLLTVTGVDAQGGRGENIGWVDLDGNIELIHEPWAEEFQDFDHAAPSPDGRWIAVEVDASAREGGDERPEIWVLDALQRQSYRLTFEGIARHPEWLPDGRIIYLRDGLDEMSSVVAQPYDRSGSEEVLLDPGTPIVDFSVSPDGARILYSQFGPESDGADVIIAPLDGSAEPERWLEGGFDEYAPAISPDGAWAAYVSTETGLPQVYVRSFPVPGRPWRLSQDRGESPTWGVGPDRLYFRSGSTMEARFLSFDDGVRAYGSGSFFPMERFEEGRVHMDAAGERFLMKVEPEGSVTLSRRIQLNVFEEIARRIEAGR
jgi:serine/threonine-protein kinase